MKPHGISSGIRWCDPSVSAAPSQLPFQGRRDRMPPLKGEGDRASGGGVYTKAKNRHKPLSLGVPPSQLPFQGRRDRMPPLKGEGDRVSGGGVQQR